MSNVDKVEQNAQLSPEEELAVLKAKSKFSKEDVARITELQELVLLEKFEAQKEEEITAVVARHSRSVVRKTTTIKNGAGKGITIKQF